MEDKKVKVLLENIQSSFRAFGEGLDSVSKDAKDIKGRIADMEGELANLKIGQEITKSDLKDIKGRLTVIDEDLKSIKPKVNKEEFQALAKKVVRLEQKVHPVK